MIAVYVLIPALLAMPSTAQSCSSARTTVQIEACLKRDLVREDQRLAALEAQVRGDLDGRSRAAFDRAATMWQSYRDQECRAVYEVNSGGTIAASSLLGCKTELAKARRVLLRRVFTSGKK